MKRLLTISILALAGCSNDKPNVTTPPVQPMPVGTMIATDTMPVAGDELNHFYFSVAIKTTAQTKDGRYDMDLTYGPNTGKAALVMPNGGQNLKPILRRRDADSYVIGFRMPDDTVFHEYYGVYGSREKIEVKAIKAYHLN